MVLTEREKSWTERYFRAVNYLSASSIYLKDNFFLERKLSSSDIKDSLLGHWGTCPGINFVYTHLNLFVKKTGQETLLVCGPGHGFAAILSNLFLEGSLEKYYPEYSLDKDGAGRMVKSFCWPGGFPSHINPGVPGAIHEGGELGYALATAFGAAFDNPELLVGVIIGDGEAETGPNAAAWQSVKFLNPKEDGAVLPILHLNGFKISSPTLFSKMSDKELSDYFSGMGYEVKFVEQNHEQMAESLVWAHQRIKSIKSESKLRWPLIILKSLKGWTGVKKFNGEDIEGSFRSHQVPLRNVKSDIKEREALEAWLRSYNFNEFIVDNQIDKSLLEFLPEDDLKIGNNKHAIGGNIIRDLILPPLGSYSLKFKEKGGLFARPSEILGKYVAGILNHQKNTNNFRIFSPDELESNKLGDILKVSGRRFFVEDKSGSNLSKTGRVMEILSEHTLQGWLQGYVLTGRHGFFPSYEAFMPIVDSMLSQYLKFLDASSNYSWRKPVSSLNYLLSSVCWRQDHNGFSHQNPGFINTLLNKAKEQDRIRLYFPADANMTLVNAEECFNSKNRVNVIVSDKQLIQQWQSLEEARTQAKVGASIWDFVSMPEPQVIFSACGSYQTIESLAAIKLLKGLIPKLRTRFVNVNELNVLGREGIYPRALSKEQFDKMFGVDVPVIFAFHGYPGAVKQLLFDRANTLRFHIAGYSERGTTTTPFDLLMKNKVSRYDLAIAAVFHLAKRDKRINKIANEVINELKARLERTRRFILENGRDPEEIHEWNK